MLLSLPCINSLVLLRRRAFEERSRLCGVCDFATCTPTKETQRRCLKKEDEQRKIKEKKKISDFNWCAGTRVRHERMALPTERNTCQRCCNYSLLILLGFIGTCMCARLKLYLHLCVVFFCVAHKYTDTRRRRYLFCRDLSCLHD